MTPDETKADSSSTRPPANLRHYVTRCHHLHYCLLLVCAIAFLVLLWYDYERTRVPFTIVFNGQPSSAWTHHPTVEGALVDAGLKLTPTDRVEPAPDFFLSPGQTISVERAIPLLIEADGRTIEWQTHQRTARAVFDEAEIGFSDHDLITVSGEVRGADEDLPTPVTTRPPDSEQSPWEQPPPRPIRLVLKRAVALYVDEGGVASPIYTTAATIGEALCSRDIVLYLGDRVNPSLGSRVAPGMKVYIERSKSVELTADSRALRTRTRGRTVADVLAQHAVSLVGSDFVEPGESTPIQEGTGIRVTRVAEARLVEQQAIPFETVWQPDKDMEIDQQDLQQEGAEGLTQRRIEVIYQDGKEISRQLDHEWVEKEPMTKIITYGTRIVPHELQTESGPMTYWRKVRMLATSYSPATSGSGKSPSHPRYGITFTGVPVQKGIVAADPKVVALRSDVYVPGYGPARVADTGGAVKGRHIDLGYSDDDLVRWYRWVDVYLVGSPPPADQVRWVLPNWPREER